MSPRRRPSTRACASCDNCEDPYLDHEPESVLLALEDGRPRGYLVGSVDGSRFPAEDKRIDAAIRTHRLFFRRESRAFFLRAIADMLGSAVRRRPTAGDFTDPRWPAHLHIAVAAEARGTGAADELVSRWLDLLRDKGSPGCHLQTLVENDRAVRFFTRAGFRAHGEALPVPGLRHRGARVHQLTMVQSL